MAEDLIGPEDKDFHVEEEEGFGKLMMMINTATGTVWVKVYNTYTEIFAGMYKQKRVVYPFFQARFPDLLSFRHPQKKIPKLV